MLKIKVTFTWVAELRIKNLIDYRKMEIICLGDL